MSVLGAERLNSGPEVWVWGVLPKWCVRCFMPEAWRSCFLRKTCQFAPSSKTGGVRRDRPELLHCHRPAFLPQPPHTPCHTHWESSTDVPQCLPWPFSAHIIPGCSPRQTHPSLNRPSQKGQRSKGCVPSQVRNPGLGFPKLGQQRGQVLRKRGAVFPEQSSPGVLPSAPASRAPPPGAPTAENSAGPPGPIVSPRSLCSWAVCFQCPGTAFPTVSRGIVVPAYVVPCAFGRGVGWRV